MRTRHLLLTLSGAILAAGLLAQTPADRHVTYAPNGTADQTLDVSWPSRPASGTQAAVLFIHGGSLQASGERRTAPMYARVCEPFVVAGIACATMDYRLAPADRWPAMPDDVAMAVRWLKARTEAHNGEPTRLFLFGHSSGCHLAAALGANPKYLERVKLAPSDLSGVILMGCMLGPLVNVPAGADLDALAARWAARSADAATYASLADRLDSDPSRWVGPHMPPTLVVVAQAERFFPPILEQGATFVRRLLEHGRPAELVVVAGTHRSSITHVPEPGDETMAAAVAFIRHPEQAGASSREP